MVQEKSFTDDLKELLVLLNKRKIKCLIVGAYATMYHAKEPRATTDF